MTDAPIATQVEQVKEASLTRLPVQVNAAFDAEIGRLVAVGVPGGVPTAGSQMPDGELLDANGRATSLGRARAGRPAVVSSTGAHGALTAT